MYTTHKSETSDMKKGTIKLPGSLPHCQLLNALSSKASARQDTDFNFIGNLDNFHQVIRAIVGQINILFPEYTPHDNQYHLKNLFHVSDKILGNEQIELMNSTELFILACSLYGHDWGMAVSDPEKHYIVTGQSPEGMTDKLRSSLEWDRRLFCTFASKHNLPLHNINDIGDINLSLWQEYIRQTHATRSSVRTKQYFETLDSAVADAISRVCESHSLKFEQLKDPHYPTIFSVLSEEVNLRALAVYLRLIDLFDFAQDRTPYVLWKYVAPRNPISAMEWAKHRSLHPITCPRYLEGRSIRVDGSTDDHEVFAALEDLHQYCEIQLKGCNDILSRMNDSRHNLGIYSLEWHVAPRGFRPVSIQFEFDRANMFDILSDEVYQGDCYVFLRELLQNSIDAIRFRRAMLQSKSYPYQDVGVIRFTVEHREDGYIIVTCTDDGIGMDEYVVRNYLAIAGKSYYRSPDFEREGIYFDPISRFGIGILSCFMVADLVEIETYKDPYLPPVSPPLRIKIPSLNRQFRTETLPPESAKPGTTVKVYVDLNKIKAKSQESPPIPFALTPYLRSIAGFVDFPILIHEGDAKTIIISPYQDPAEATSRFGKEYQVTSISLNYPWDEAILPQDLPTALATLTEEHYDLKNDLKIDDYEGVLVYLFPRDDSTYFSTGPWGRELRIHNCQNDDLVGSDIRWHTGYAYRSNRALGKTSLSSEHLTSFRIYRDGILVPRISPPVVSTMPAKYRQRQYEYFFGDAELTNTYLLLANLTKSNLPRVDLSRTDLTDKKGEWAETIFQAHLHHILDKHLDQLIRLEPADRLLKLARWSIFYNLAPEAIWQLFPKEYWPIPLLQDSCKIFFTNFEILSDKSICLPPEFIRPELGHVVNNLFITHEEYNGCLTKWVGQPCLALFGTDVVQSISVYAIRVFFRLLLGNTHHFASVNFLKPPWEGNPPILQYVFEPIEIPHYTPEETNDLLDKGSKNTHSLGNAERILLWHHLDDFLGRCPHIAIFPQPFDKSYAYENKVLNIKHPKVELLFHILSKILLSTRLNAFNPDTLGQLRDAAKKAISEMPSRFHHTQKDYSSWALSLRNLGEIAKRTGISSEDATILIPHLDEFVPDSFDFLDIRLHFTEDEDINEFGQIL
jgi:hypothetical protein